jgi:hypothetical protein
MRLTVSRVARRSGSPFVTKDAEEFVSVDNLGKYIFVQQIDSSATVIEPGIGCNSLA